MAVVPSKDLSAIQFFESHLPVWTANTAAIGLTPALITSLVKAASDARAAYDGQQTAKQAAKASTTSLHDSVDTLRSVGGDLIKTIKAFADTTNNPSVFVTAEIDPPAPPSPAPAPGIPTNFKIELTPGGAIKMSWKSTNSAASSGAFFTIKRKLAGETNFTLVGNAGAKNFTDETIPQGIAGATYIVQGFRGQKAGPQSEQFTFQFGVNAGPSLASDKLKIAA